MEGTKLKVKVTIEDSTGITVTVPAFRLLEMPLHPSEIGPLARKTAEGLAEEIKTIDLSIAPNLFNADGSAKEKEDADLVDGILRPGRALADTLEPGGSIEITSGGRGFRIEKTKSGKIKTTGL